MKKILGILIISFLLSTIAYAEKRKSQLNLFFELPENYILSSELTLENIDKYTTTETEKNEWIELMKIGQPYSGTEAIFTKKMLIDGGDFIQLFSVKRNKNFWTGEKIKNDFDNYCKKRLEVIKNSAKDKKNKRNNEKEVIKNHKCLLVDIPKFVDFSIFESYLDLTRNTIVVYMAQFAISKSDRKITIFLHCEKYCDEILPVYENLLATTYFGECIEGDCENGSGTLAYNDGSKYIGEFKGGIENGTGSWLHKDGAKHIGNFLKGYLNGYGEYIFQDGQKYYGDFKDGLAHGKGTWIYSNESSYTGDMKFGNYDGFGIESFANGETYKGGFKNGKHHGETIWVFGNGSKFEGTVDSETGFDKGTFTYADGVIYKGEFKDKFEHGKGMYIFPNGNKYIGEVKKGKIDGYGTYIWKTTGHKYVGEFKNDKKNGKGTLTYPDGKIEKGTWENDKLIKSE